MEVDQDKRITVYFGDRKQGVIKPEIILENKLGYSFEIAEFQLVPYEELLQISVRKAHENNPYANFEEDRLTTFLEWCDNYLCEFGTFNWIDGPTGNRELWLSHFYYTRMTKYQDVINEKIFDRNTKVCVIKTSRPIIKKIIQHINLTEPSGMDNL